MSNTPKIDVREQARLSFEKSFRFCVKGISYRLLRSSLTLAVVVVAVAFFTVLLSESLMVRSTAVGVHEEMAAAREADILLMHLFYNYSSRELSLKLAGMVGDQARLAEFGRVAGLSQKEAADLAAQCRVEQLYLQFFRTLSPGKRVVLAKKYAGRDIFAFLTEPEPWASFLEALGKMRSVRLPTDSATFRTFLDNRGTYMDTLERARQARAKNVDALEHKLKLLTGDVEYAGWLGEAGADKIEQWRQEVEASGFNVSSETMGRVREILHVSSLEERISRLLQSPETREAWKVKMQDTPGLETKLSMLKDERVATLLNDAFSAEDRASVADRFARMKHLRKLVAKLPARSEVVVGEEPFMDGRQVFLVIISFLVCMVGITNAMLMSITERFREIATMKCLGATDGFILKQFLIEAAIQGVFGGTVGMLIGMVISVSKSALVLGSAVFSHFPGMQMVGCAVVTVVVGVVLAMLASIYPSRAAAKMAPMDAMRVE